MKIYNELRTTSDKIGVLLEANFGLTMLSAEAWLLDFSHAITKWCLKLRYGEEQARKIEAQIDDAEPPAASDGELKS